MPVHSKFEAGLEEELQRPRRDLPGDAYPFRANRNRSEHDNVLSGKLEQMSLFSVLQAVSENRSSGNLIVHGADERGSIYVEDGQVVYVSIGRHKGAKAFYRLVELTEGKFEFFSPGRLPPERNLVGKLDVHLLEAARQQDELAVVREKIPNGAAALAFNPAITAPVAKIPHTMLEVMVAVHKHETVAAIIDGCTLPDLDVCSLLLSLLNNDVVRVVRE